VVINCSSKGQNGGVTIEAGGRVGAQSRNTFLDKGTGLGEYVHHNRAYFANLFRPDAEQAYTRLSVFGEWCGPRVQKGVALSMLAKPIFAVFAIQLDDAIVYEPEDLTAFLTHNNTVPVFPSLLLPLHLPLPLLSTRILHMSNLLHDGHLAAR
jgi:hypothetical protein